MRDPFHRVGGPGSPGPNETIPPGRPRKPEPEVVHIARCPEHGLHGERDECFVCGRSVEKVAMVPAAALARSEAECKDLKITVSTLLAELEDLNDELRDERNGSHAADGGRS